MTDVDPLVEFIQDRLDEDERVARALVDRDRGHWTLANSFTTSMGGALDPQGRLQHIRTDSEGGNVANRHLERHDPARVLRAVEAKRLVVDLYETAVGLHETAMADYDRTGTMADSHEVIKTASKRSALRDAVMSLAAEWNIHEVYQANREKWQP